MALWNLNGKTVLIIDDFPQMRSMLKSMLQPYGAKEIKQAPNGEEAIELMTRQQFDLVLCDYNLGEGKDGQQVLEEAKYQKILPYYTLFVMVTAENTNAMVMGAAEYQPDAYLSKPINKTVLISRLEKLMAKKEQLKPLSNAIERGAVNSIIQCCDDLLKQDIKYRLEILKLKCEQLLELEKYDETLEICKSILDERDIPWAMMITGKIHFINKQYDDALGIFENIISTHQNFMPAYDWMAKTLDKKSDHVESQNILMEAIKQSPKSLLRQRSLAEVADKNKDYEVTQKARKQVVSIGKTSCLKEPSDYTKLAKVLVTNSSPKEALKVLDNTRHVFKGDKKALVESTVEMGMVHKAMGNQTQYEQNVQAALELAKSDSTLLRGDVAMDLARSCMELGMDNEANELIKSVVREHHEDPEMLKKIDTIFRESGKSAEGEKLIAAAKKEVIEINNKGVSLMKEGNMDDAIKLFIQAAKELPDNPTINLNAAKSIIMNMQKTGHNPRMQKEAYKYLDVVFRIDPESDKARKLQTQCRELSA